MSDSTAVKRGEVPPQNAEDVPGASSASRSLTEGGQSVPPFLASLACLARRKGYAFSLGQLAAHLPGGFTPPTVEECLRASELAGAAPRVAAVPDLTEIPQPALPCVVLLGSADDATPRCCVLLAVEAGEGEGEPFARVILPESDPEESRIPFADIAKDYAGMAVFLPQSKPRHDPRMESMRLLKPRHWFWGVLREFAPTYRDVALGSFVVNVLGLAGPLFIMNVYDRVVPNNATYTLWVLALGLLLAHGMDFVLRNLRSHFVDVAGRNADVIIASRLMDRVVNMRLADKPESTGAMVNNLREFDLVRDFFGSTTLLALFDLPFLLLFVVLVALIGGPMVFLLVAALPLTLGFVWLVQMPFQRSVERQLKQNMQKNSFLTEVMSGLETVKSIVAQGQLKNRWESLVDAAAGESAHTRRLASLAQTGTMFITCLLSASVIIFGVYRIKAGVLSQGELIACVILVGRALGPIMQIATMITHMQKAGIALRALDKLIAIPVEENAATASATRGLEPELALAKATFRYPGAATSALRDVTLTIRPGEKVGIVGSTGSGKSTLARLLAGLYAPEDGSVTFGGVDMRQLDKADLRSRVGFMPQETFLFYGTVRENIALGSPWMDMKRLVHAAEIAGVADFVRRHPAGYDMPVGERGLALSGGQRQAVALARTVARSPEVLILDEPSSNLDMEGEHKLMLRLRDVVRGKTLVVLTHRPSLLALVDRIVVMQEGAIVADGPRDAVLRALDAANASGRGGMHG